MAKMRWVQMLLPPGEQQERNSAWAHPPSSLKLHQNGLKPCWLVFEGVRTGRSEGVREGIQIRDQSKRFKARFRDIAGNYTSRCSRHGCRLSEKGGAVNRVGGTAARRRRSAQGSPYAAVRRRRKKERGC